MSGATPDSTARDGDRPEALVPIVRPVPASPINPGAVLREAWRLFSIYWPACLVIYWGAAAAAWVVLNGIVLLLGVANLAFADPAATPFLSFLRFLALVLVPAWMWLGQCLSMLKLVRMEPVTVQDLFRGGPYLLTTLLAAGVFLAIAAIPGLLIYGATWALVAIGGGDPLVAAVWRFLPRQTPPQVAEVESSLIVLMGLALSMLALAYAAFFAVRVRLRPFAFVILDRDSGVAESLRISMQLSRGRASSLLVIHLAQFTVNLAGLLLCCVGLFVTLPFTGLISAVTYNALSADLPPLEAPEDDEAD